MSLFFPSNKIEHLVVRPKQLQMSLIYNSCLKYDLNQTYTFLNDYEYFIKAKHSTFQQYRVQQ